MAISYPAVDGSLAPAVEESALFRLEGISDAIDLAVGVRALGDY